MIGKPPLQLAHVWKGEELTRPMLFDVKLDGIRCVIIKRNDEINAYSRSGKPIYNCTHILEALLNIKQDFVLDGEMYAGSWDDTISICKSSRKVILDERIKKLAFVVFDHLTIEEWDARRCERALVERVAYAEIMIENLKGKVKPLPITLIASCTVRFKRDIEKAFARFLEKGFEGGMLKDPRSYYEFKRSWAWQKIKPNFDADLEIFDADEEVALDGTLKNALGALRVRGRVEYNGKDYEILSTGVGTGFTRAQREELWRQHKLGKLVGRIVEVKFQEVSQNDHSREYALRFPCFKRIREDR